MTELALKQDTTPAPAPANDGAIILGMIDRLLARPDVAIEKLEQMFELHRKVQAETARRSFLAAFAALQSELPAAVRNGTGHNSKKYARYEDVATALREPFSKHGFSHWFNVDQVNDRVKITTCLGHEAGHVEQTSMLLPLDTSGGKTPMHAFGSTVSYGKRYGLLTVTGIATDDDDDGKAAGDKQTDTTVEVLKALIKETNSDVTWFLTNYSVEDLDDLTAKQRNEAHGLLLQKKAVLREKTNARR